LPTAIDGAMSVATVTAVVMRRMGRSTLYPWTVVLVNAAFSVAGNALHAYAGFVAEVAAHGCYVGVGDPCSQPCAVGAPAGHVGGFACRRIEPVGRVRGTGRGYTWCTADRLAGRPGMWRSRKRVPSADALLFWDHGCRCRT
jgi:hypothetical protein